MNNRPPPGSPTCPRDPQPRAAADLMEQPQEPALPQGPRKGGDAVQEVALRYLSFPVSP